MTKSEHQTFLYNVLMSQYDNSEVKVEPLKVIEETYYSPDNDFGCHIEPLQISLAKDILGNDFLDEGKNYRLVTTLEGMSIVCDIDDKEKVFYLHNEKEEYTPPAPKLEYSSYSNKFDYKSLLPSFAMSIMVVIVILLILILNMG